MARPVKSGLDYFPLDTDFFDDDKVVLISTEFMAKGESVLVRLLCKIYKNGYFYRWGEDERSLFCRTAGGIYRPELVKEIVEGCLRRSIFDKKVYEMFGILTSGGIQKRYLQATLERKSIDIISNYWLLDLPDGDRFNILQLDENGNIVNRSNNGVNRSNNGVKRSNNPQRKVKKIKEKEKRGFVPPELSEVIKYFSENGYQESSARKAFNYYNVAEWKDGKGNQVQNWKQKMITVWFKPEHLKSQEHERKEGIPW